MGSRNLPGLLMKEESEEQHMESFNPKSWAFILCLFLSCSSVFAEQTPRISNPSGTTGKVDAVSAPAPGVENDGTTAPPKADGDAAPDAAAIEDANKDARDGSGPDEARGAPAEKAPQEPTDPAAESSGPIQWNSKEQKSLCESHLTRLRESFVRTRYHSIQGDSCVTAEHARLFLELSETCRKECPPGLLEKNGYNEKIMRNMNWLHRLGKERCLK